MGLSRDEYMRLMRALDAHGPSQLHNTITVLAKHGVVFETGPVVSATHLGRLGAFVCRLDHGQHAGYGHTIIQAVIHALAAAWLDQDTLHAGGHWWGPGGVKHDLEEVWPRAERVNPDGDSD